MKAKFRKILSVILSMLIISTVMYVPLAEDFVLFAKAEEATDIEFGYYYDYDYETDEEYIVIDDVPYDFSGRLVIPSEYDGYKVSGVSLSWGNGITEIVIPEGVTYVYLRNLYNLTTVELPSTVSSLNISYCNLLTNITLSSENKYFLIEDNILFSKDKTVLKQIFDKSITSFTIPEGVTQIGYSAFEGCENLTNITFPSTLTYIGNSAFANCTSLKSVSIPEGVTEIDGYAFEECENLTTVNFPSTLTHIGYSAFSYCTSLKSVSIPEGVTEIDDSAFSYCTSLRTVYIPSTVTSLSGNIFEGCSNLISLEISNNNSNYSSDDCAVFSKDKKELVFFYNGKANSYTIPSHVTSIGSSAFYNCDNLTNITIPDTVITIGFEAFAYCDGLTSIVIPDSVTELGGCAFYHCSNLEYVKLSENLTALYSGLFESCYKLTTITIPASVKTLSSDTFILNNNPLAFINVDENNPYFMNDEYGVLFNKDKTELICFPGKNTLTEYTIPDTVKVIGEEAFKYASNLTKVVIPDSVTTIGYGAFYYCSNLNSINIPSSITEIGENALYGTAYYNNNKVCEDGLYYLGNILLNADYDIPENVVIKDGTTLIASGIFNNKDMISVVFPDTVTVIPSDMFEYCYSLESVTLSDSITYIGERAFYYCENLTNINFPDSLVSIGDYAFSSCSSISEIFITENIKDIGDDAFSECTGLTAFYVDPDNAYYSAMSGVLFNKDKTELILYPCGKTGTEYKIPDTVKVIRGYTFYKTSLTKIILPENLEKIEEAAFLLTSFTEPVRIPASVSEIELLAFGYCEIPGFIVDEDNQYYSSDKYGVLYNKDKTTLIQFPMHSENTEYTIPEGVKEIADGAFYLNIYIRKLNFPDSLENIGELGFYLCLSLETLVFSENSVIEPMAYVSNIMTKSLTIYDNVDFGDNIYKAQLFNYTAVYWFCFEEITFYDRDFDFSGITGLGKSTFRIKEEYKDQAENIYNALRYYYIVRFKQSYGFPVTEEDIRNYREIEKYINCIEGQLLNPEAPTLPRDNFKIRCYKGSTAEAYALEHDIEIEYLCEHLKTETIPAVEAGCTTPGLTEGTKCSDCGEILVKQQEIDSGVHSYTSEITTPATHTSEGVETFTCECGDTYSEVLPKLTEHSYESVVTDPTCTEKGFTTYTCICGDTYIDNYVDANGHSYTSEITTPATHTSEGTETFTCECGDSYTEVLPKLTEHSYESVVTDPTCTEKGFTTYTCICGDTYIDNYVDKLPHDYVEVITTPATHTAEGLKTFTCDCGDSYTETIEKIAEHKYEAVVTAPECLKGGFTTYTCECGDSYVADETSALGHNLDASDVCTRCGYTIDAQVTIGTVSGRPGDTVTLYFTLNKEINIKSMSIIDINYDSDKVTLTNGEWLTQGGILTDWDQAEETGAIAFKSNTPFSGDIFSLTFTINEGVEDCNVPVSCDFRIKAVGSDRVETFLNIALIPGNINIFNVIKGDVNGDDFVDSDDAIHLLYHTLIPERYEVNQNCDFNNDGFVDSDDAIYLLYHTLIPERYPLI